MIIRNLRSGRRLAVLAVFAIVAVSALGFAANNTVPASKAGDGVGAITGYTVSNIHYELDSSNPAEIDEVHFSLDAAANTVRVAVNGTNSSSCTNTIANDWECLMPSGVGVNAANELRVVAAD
ncbi:MAG: hypothetical protein M9925_08565 [Chloroflexi bacterium]|nr:hypothetical protein [Chloroflexota bacterium]